MSGFSKMNSLWNLFTFELNALLCFVNRELQNVVEKTEIEILMFLISKIEWEYYGIHTTKCALFIIT